MTNLSEGQRSDKLTSDYILGKLEEIVTAQALTDAISELGQMKSAAIRHLG